MVRPAAQPGIPQNTSPRLSAAANPAPAAESTPAAPSGLVASYLSAFSRSSVAQTASRLPGVQSALSIGRSLTDAVRSVRTQQAQVAAAVATRAYAAELASPARDGYVALLTNGDVPAAQAGLQQVKANCDVERLPEQVRPRVRATLAQAERALVAPVDKKKAEAAMNELRQSLVWAMQSAEETIPGAEYYRWQERSAKFDDLLAADSRR